MAKLTKQRDEYSDEEEEGLYVVVKNEGDRYDRNEPSMELFIGIGSHTV